MSKDEALDTLANSGIARGQRYQHYKGGFYEVLGVGIFEATEQPVVIYRSEKDSVVWVRTLQDFQSHVVRDGGMVRRFALT